MEVNKNQRCEYIDFAKGIAIILVVIAHSYSRSNFLVKYISSFHMTSFFIIAGMLYGIKYKRNKCVEFNMNKKIHSLLIPYIIFAILYQSFIATLRLIGNQLNLKKAVLFVVKEVLTLEGGVVWFLTSLFIAEFIFLKTLNKRKVNIILSLVLMFVGLYVPYANKTFVNSLLRAFVGCGFVAIGFYGCNIFNKKTKNIFLILYFIAHIVLVNYNGFVSMIDREWGNKVVFLCTGVLGTFVLIQVSMRIKFERKISSIISYCGKNSIIILCLHVFIIEIIRLLDYRLFGNMLYSLGLMEGIFFMLIQMIIIIPIIPICNRYFSWAFGKTKVK